MTTKRLNREERNQSTINETIRKLQEREEVTTGLGLTVPVPVAKGGTGQTTEAEALGEMTQALSAVTVDRTADYLAYYDASGDTGAKVLVQTFSPWQTVIKIADESITNDNTISDDAVLLFAVAASTKYAFRIKVFYTTGASGDFKYDVNGPASPTLVGIEHYVHEWAVGDSTDNSTAFADTQTAATGAATDGFIRIDGIVHNGTSPGTVNFRWAQNTSNGTATIVRAGSYLEWMTVV